MRRRIFFLGATCALAAAAAFGCGSVVTVSPPGGTGGRSHTTGEGGDQGFGGDVADAGEDYHDPGCPDAGMKKTDFMCDPFNQHNGDCPPGDGCYIFATPPQTICGQEVYGAQCAPEGAGKQGAPCSGGNDCAPGLDCVVTGSGDQCVVLCELMGPSECPDGLVCQPIDVQGFGGCL